MNSSRKLKACPTSFSRSSASLSLWTAASGTAAPNTPPNPKTTPPSGAKNSPPTPPPATASSPANSAPAAGASSASGNTTSPPAAIPSSSGSSKFHVQNSKLVNPVHPFIRDVKWPLTNQTQCGIGGGRKLKCAKGERPDNRSGRKSLDKKTRELFTRPRNCGLLRHRTNTERDCGGRGGWRGRDRQDAYPTLAEVSADSSRVAGRLQGNRRDVPPFAAFWRVVLAWCCLACAGRWASWEEGLPASHRKRRAGRPCSP